MYEITDFLFDQFESSSLEITDINSKALSLAQSLFLQAKEVSTSREKLLLCYEKNQGDYSNFETGSTKYDNVFLRENEEKNKGSYLRIKMQGNVIKTVFR